LIIVDTNVISELTRRVPAPEVVSWLDTLAASDVATTAITARSFSTPSRGSLLATARPS
jgi:predicted nucleic acid-binding protein